MAMTYKATGGAEFEKVPAGTHIAVCNLVADVGLQPGSAAFPDPKRKLFLRFEVPSERTTYTKDGEEKEGPMTIYANFTASMNKKANMRKALEGWRGKKFTDADAEAFDVSSILGKACMILVTHSESGGKVYANVDNIMALPKGTKAPKAENPLVLYSNEQDAQYNDLPKFLRDKVDNQLFTTEEPTRPANSSGSAKTSLSPQTTSDAEADRIAAQQDADPEDAIPFS